MNQPVTIDFMKKEICQRIIRVGIFSVFCVVGCLVAIWKSLDDLARGAMILVAFSQLLSMAGIAFMGKMSWILDENGITKKSPLGVKTSSWDSVLEYGIEPSQNQKNCDPLIQIVLGSPKRRITVPYTEETISWLKRRCGAPSYDKRKKPSP